MTADKQPPEKESTKKADKQERLAKALRANLVKRKLQQRQRENSQQESEPVK